MRVAVAQAAVTLIKEHNVENTDRLNLTPEQAARLTVVDHPLVQHKLSILRDEQTGTKQFRDIVRELAMFEGYEATRDFALEPVEVTTPLETCVCQHLAGKKVAIVPILRAGLGMVDGILDLRQKAIRASPRRPSPSRPSTATAQPSSMSIISGMCMT